MLHYDLIGRGSQQLIFIHGNSQSSKIWDKVITRSDLENNYTILSVDLPGHGKSFHSKVPEQDYSIPGMSKYLKTFINQHSKREYVVIANSAATNLVSEICHLLINCKGICLIGPSIVGEGIGPENVLQPNPHLTAFFTTDPSPEDIYKMIDEGSYDIDIDKENYKQIFLATDPAFRKNWYASILKSEWIDEIKNLNGTSLPVAIVYGKEEKFANISYLEKSALANKWKNEIILIPNAGHLIQYDQPALLAAVIKEFADDCFK